MKVTLLTLLAALSVCASASAQESCDMTIPLLEKANHLASQVYAQAAAPRLAAQGIHLIISSAQMVASQITGQDEIEIKTAEGRLVSLHNSPNLFADSSATKRGYVCQALMAADGITGVFDAKDDSSLVSFVDANGATNVTVPNGPVMTF